MNSRSKAFFVLDANIIFLRERVDEILNQWYGIDWKGAFFNRVVRDESKEIIFTDLDYNNLPNIWVNFKAKIEANINIIDKFNGDLLDVLYRLRDTRNRVAHHLEFREKDLRLLLSDLKIIFKALNMKKRLIILDDRENKYIHLSNIQDTSNSNFVEESNESYSTLANNSLPKDINPDIIINCFFISNSLRFKGLYIKTIFSSGSLAGRCFLYSHDKVYDIFTRSGHTGNLFTLNGEYRDEYEVPEVVLSAVIEC